MLRRLLVAWFWLAFVGVSAGCDLRTPDLKPDGKIDIPDIDDIDDLKAEAKSILHKLFPDLSDAEIAEISGKLSLSDVLALRTELEAIRKEVVEFSADLFKSSTERVADRKSRLEPHNDGFPETIAALGQVCSYDGAAKRGEILLSGVFKGKQAVTLTPEQVELKIDGAAQTFDLQCIAGGPSVDIVFLIDITGSMSNVIDSVRDSVVRFVDLIEASGVRGTLSVVSYQDSVGVNRSFQDPAPPNNYERSPFFAPVSLSDAGAIDRLRAFVNRLEANRGADAPENLAGAIDFARNSVIGYGAGGEPNVIGEGRDDPAGTAPFPKLTSDKQIFVALTDITFHGDDRTPSNSSLLAPFVPRNAADILASLQRTGTTIHVSDPSSVDASLDPSSSAVDADYWAIHTGGVGEDIVEGYSLVDLELVVVAEKAGLLDITLDQIIGTSCTLEFEGNLAANAQLELTLNVDGVQATSKVRVERR